MESGPRASLGNARALSHGRRSRIKLTFRRDVLSLQSTCTDGRSVPWEAKEAFQFCIPKVAGCDRLALLATLSYTADC